MQTAVAHGTVDAVLWFTSLHSHEQGVTRRILDDLEPQLARVGLHHQVFEVTTAAQFLGTLRAVAIEAGSGSLKPIIHLDMHGSAENGLMIAASGEWVPWDELADVLSDINAALQNNLFVVSCACHGQHFIKATKLLRTCPYFVLVAPKQAVAAGFIEDRIPKFYEAMFEGDDFVAAHRQHLTPEFFEFHSEKLLYIAIVDYVHKYCTGRGGIERREALMDEAVAAGFEANPDLRRMIKAGVAADQTIIDKFADIFLAGKRPQFGFEEVKKGVQRRIEQRQQQQVR
jgi:hypothetical protein